MDKETVVKKAWILGMEKCRFKYLIHMDTFIDGEVTQCQCSRFYNLDLVNKKLVTDMGTFDVVETYREFLQLKEE